ncbi:MAG: FGGY-family carbohydrate kinase, partial [Planctomycetota bacterium]
MSFMGVDIGTTGCKVIVFDADGKELATEYKEYPLITPQPGWAELDARLVIDNCKECIAKVAAIVKDSDPVQAIAMSSQGEAFTVLDDKDKFLCNAMVSFDTRCRKQVAEFTEKVGLDNLYNTTGASPHTMFTVFKIIWLRENQPRILEKANRILCFQDLLAYELTGQAAIDFSLAARTMMWDVNKKDWSGAILDKVGIDATVLPKPLPSGEVVGKVKKQISQQLGLSQDVIVAAGGHDQPCGAFGAGVVEPGIASYATGTVECITPAFNQLTLNDTLKNSNLAVYPHVVGGLYITIAFNLTGGNLLRWYRDQFAHEEVRLAQESDQDAYDLIIKQAPAEETNLLVLPHFVSTGTPHFDTSSTGAILGLNL